MEEREVVARIRRIERILEIEDVPGLLVEDIKKYREGTGCSFQYALSVIRASKIQSLFEIER